MGKITVYGLPGVYNATPLALTDGDGVALAVDDQGRLILSSDFPLSTTVVGSVADDAITPGDPVMIGGFAKNFDGTDPGNVSAENDVARFITDLNRRHYVNTVHPQFWSYHSNGSTALTDASVKADPGDNYSIFVTDIIFSNGSTTAMNIFFEEGSTTVLGPYYLEAINGRGVHIKFETPKQITASTALTVTTSAATAHAVDVTGFVARV